uniref:L1 transposable element RRM domain-containing protein n=1 Tax=Gouania willdenowi TaxID=441366 RepID=A0A8C5DT07_GOUWI
SAPCRTAINFTFQTFSDQWRGPSGGAKANANKAIDSSNDELGPEDELSEQRDKLIVNCVTANIEKMLDSKLANIIKPVSEFSGKLDSLIQRMGTAEQRISDLEDTSAATAPRVKALEGELQKALDRLENFENQSRRQNLRIVGLNEGSEGRTPVEFFEKWIPDVLGMQTDRIKLDRAHRTGPPTRLSGKEGPRAVLVRLHDYTNKQKILQAARNRGTLSIDGSNVSFYQDFSVEVVRRRKESANARKQLREAGIRYSFLYPAVIKVFHSDGTSSSFSTTKEIDDYVNKMSASD